MGQTCPAQRRPFSAYSFRPVKEYGAVGGRIWSPPVLQGLCLEWQGQDCCRISGLLLEGLTLPGHNDVRAYRPYRDHGLCGPSPPSGFRYAGLTCLAITVDKAFAIRGGSFPSSVCFS